MTEDAARPTLPPAGPYSSAADPTAPLRGRPLALTKEVADRIVASLELGGTIVIACGYGGIKTDTFRKCLEQGRAFRAQLEAGVDPEGRPLTKRARERLEASIYVDFVGRVENASGVAATKWLAQVENAGATDWRAAAWRLERRFPNDYGKTVQEVQVGPTLASEAEKLARELGLDPGILLAVAEAIAGEDAAQDTPSGAE